MQCFRELHFDPAVMIGGRMWPAFQGSIGVFFGCSQFLVFQSIKEVSEAGVLPRPPRRHLVRDLPAGWFDLQIQVRPSVGVEHFHPHEKVVERSKNGLLVWDVHRFDEVGGCLRREESQRIIESICSWLAPRMKFFHRRSLLSSFDGTFFFDFFGSEFFLKVMPDSSCAF